MGCAGNSCQRADYTKIQSRNRHLPGAECVSLCGNCSNSRRSSSAVFRPSFEAVASRRSLNLLFVNNSPRPPRRDVDPKLLRPIEASGSFCRECGPDGKKLSSSSSPTPSSAGIARGRKRSFRVDLLAIHFEARTYSQTLSAPPVARCAHIRHSLIARASPSGSKPATGFKEIKYLEDSERESGGIRGRSRRSLRVGYEMVTIEGPQIEDCTLN